MIPLFVSARANPNRAFCYPHDFEQRDIPKIYLVDDSRGHVVTIKADETLIWEGIVKKSDFSPNIHVVGVPPNLEKKCHIHVAGGPYGSTQEVDWTNGMAMVIVFSENKVVFDQHKEPVGFQ